jgi:hypothetical protein
LNIVVDNGENMKVPSGASLLSSGVEENKDGESGALPRRWPTRNEILSKCIDGGSVMTIIGAATLLFYDIRDYPACDPGTVISGPSLDGYYEILKCVDQDHEGPAFADDINATLFDLDDDFTQSELYDDGLSASTASTQVECTTTRSQRPCDMGAILVCEGGLDSEYLLTVICSVLWALAQLYLAIPILLGGINTCEIESHSLSFHFIVLIHHSSTHVFMRSVLSLPSFLLSFLRSFTN